MTKDTIISIDFETFGGIPGVHSAVSIGAVAFHAGKEVSSFYAKMKELPWAKRDADTMEWWKGQPDAWEEINKGQEEPQDVMNNFYQWAIKLPGTPKTRVFAANPNSYDSGFLIFYCYKFLGNLSQEISYRLRVLDVRTYFAAIAGLDYSKAERYKMPTEWTENLVINHRAVDDARQQGHTLMHMFRLAMDEEEGV